MKAFWAIFKARNIEFWRDRATLGWNLMFPVLLIIGFAFMFNNDDKVQYHIGWVGSSDDRAQYLDTTSLRYVDFIEYDDVDAALEKLRYHRVDLVVMPGDQSLQYWLNDDSPSGYITEQLVRSNLLVPAESASVTGEPIRYLDWVAPGILGMNMMFSCLFGVGYVIVRYRKNGVLKRFQATPVTPFMFLSAQVASRLLVVLFITTSIFTAMALLFDFIIKGNAVLLLLIAALAAMSMISLGLLVSARSGSEELAGGLLNLITWPMMLLSGVWFSLEGAAPAIQWAANIFPLTHALSAARSVMLDGASLIDIAPSLITLFVMTIVFLGVAAKMFKWGDN